MKTLCHTLVVLAALAFPFMLQAEEKDKAVTHVDAKQAAKLVEEKKVEILDVRTPDEYKDGHIAGAKNIDFTEDDFAAKVQTLDKTKPYLVHCAAGGRSTKSLDTLKKAGFTQLYHLDGGFKGWQAAGLPSEK